MVALLSSSRVVNVQVNLGALLASQLPINSAIFIGTSAVIDATELYRKYGTLQEVGVDFSNVSPEYLGAVLWFGQSPQPTELYLGRWFNVASGGQLLCGPLAAANRLTSAWTAITNGGFLVYVDGVPYAVGACNFSSPPVLNLNAVANVVQTQLVAAGATGATVVYDANFQRFVETSGTTGLASSVSFLQPPTAIGSYNFAGQPTGGTDSITIGGTAVAYVTGTPTGNQVQVGLSVAATLAATAAFLNGFQRRQPLEGDLLRRRHQALRRLQDGRHRGQLVHDDGLVDQRHPPARRRSRAVRRSTCRR